MQEIWKPIDPDGKYEVSSLGRVRSMKCRTRLVGHIFKPSLSNGYPRVNLRLEGRPVYKFVHRLVAIAFCNKRPEHTEVNHINGIKYDNRVENLEWVTRSENQRHAWELGLHTKQLGESNHSSRITADIALKIRNRRGKETLKTTAKHFNVSPSLVGKIQRGELWSHV